MGAKTVECVICGEQVSKRATLALEAFEGRSGRACREHPEVQALLEKKASIQRVEKAFDEVEEKMRVMGHVSAIRMMNAVHGHPFDDLFAQLRRQEPNSGIVDRVIAEAKAMGPMSDAEVNDAVAGAVDMMARRMAGGR